MSILGDITNIDQSLSGNGIEELDIDIINVNTINGISGSYLNNITSNVQAQINTLNSSINNIPATYQVKGDYLTITNASNTYQPKGDYLTTTNASNTYQPKGDYLTNANASNTYKTITSSNTDLTAATASITAAYGVAIAAAVTTLEGEISTVGTAAAVAQTTADEAQTTADTAVTYSRYFLSSNTPEATETCSAILRIKDSAGISTVHNFDRTGNYTYSGELKLSPAGSALYPFKVNTTGDMTSNSVITSDIKAPTDLNINFSNPLGGTKINIGTNTGGLVSNTINIGSSVDVIRINGFPYLPFSLNSTGFFNQLGF